MLWGMRNGGVWFFGFLAVGGRGLDSAFGGKGMGLGWFGHDETSGVAGGRGGTRADCRIGVVGGLLSNSFVCLLFLLNLGIWEGCPRLDVDLIS